MADQFTRYIVLCDGDVMTESTVDLDDAKIIAADWYDSGHVVIVDVNLSPVSTSRFDKLIEQELESRRREESARVADELAYSFGGR